MTAFVKGTPVLSRGLQASSVSVESAWDLKPYGFLLAQFHWSRHMSSILYRALHKEKHELIRHFCWGWHRVYWRQVRIQTESQTILRLHTKTLRPKHWGLDMFSRTHFQPNSSSAFWTEPKISLESPGRRPSILTGIFCHGEMHVNQYYIEQGQCYHQQRQNRQWKDEK